ncbi:MAG: hypothetical protein HYT76_02425 [Deltaproteobacteria bacterium]|nr:hypothetical protein [Deltaproteobacteria bacterium]
MSLQKIPLYWEEILKRYVKKTFYADTRKKSFADREGFTEGDYRFFARGVRRLNEFFTTERGELPRNYFNQKDLRSGYLLYFLPVNALKVAALLKIPPCPPLSKGGGGDLTILDIGSGPGTGMFGVMLWLENWLKNLGAYRHTPLQIRWILIDQNREALRDAQNLHEEILNHLKRTGLPIESHLEIKVGDITHFSKSLGSVQADLILSLNALSEIPKPRRLSLVENLLGRHLKSEGKLLIMEPALRLTTRDLMELHDEILHRKSGFVYAPCLHQSSCPMLKVNDRDWCHTYIEWERPEWIQRLDHLVGIRKDYLKCSYLLLGKEDTSERRIHSARASQDGGFGGEVREAAPRNNTWRVVSGHLNSNGKSELLLCGPGGLPDLLRTTRLDRDRSEANQVFDQTQRGEIIEMDRTTRIGKETVIKKI